MDKYSRKLLWELQQNGRQTIQDLSDKIGLSTAPCWRRVKELEDNGIIRGYVALIDRNKIGLHACLLTHVSLERHSNTVVEDFERAVQETPEILECYVTTGDADYLLKIVVENTEEYDRFLHRFMFKVKGIRQMKTSVALREVKVETRLRVPDSV